MEKEKYLKAIRSYREHTASFDETVKKLNAQDSQFVNWQEKHQSLWWELEVISMMEDEFENSIRINQIFDEIIKNIDEYDPYTVLTIIPKDMQIKIFSEINSANRINASETSPVTHSERAFSIYSGDCDYVSFAVFLNKNIMLKELLDIKTPLIDKIDFLPLNDVVYVEDCIDIHAIPYVSEEFFLRCTVFSDDCETYSLFVSES